MNTNYRLVFLRHEYLLLLIHNNKEPDNKALKSYCSYKHKSQWNESPNLPMVYGSFLSTLIQHLDLIFQHY